MKLLTMDLKNFRSHADTSLAFPSEGVTGIIGENESGKSSLNEALLWALYGGSTTRGTMDGLRWTGAAARQTAAVTLRFALAGTTYRVERGENTAKLVNEATGQVLAEGTAPVNEAMPDVLGMSYAEFTSSYVCLQDDIKRLSTMLPTERVGFIREVMGMGRIDDAIKACRKRKAALSEELRGFDLGLGDREPLVAAVERAKERLVERKERVRDASIEYERSKEALADAEAAWTKEDKAKAEHDQLQRDVKQAKERIEQADLELERLEERQSRQAEAKVRLAEAEPMLARRADLEAERETIREVKAVQSERATLETRAKELESDLQTHREALESAAEIIEAWDEEALGAAVTEASAAKKQSEEMEKARHAERARLLAEAKAHEAEAKKHHRRLDAITDAGDDGDCPTCLRRLGDQFQAVINVLARQQDEASDAAEAARFEASELTDPSDDEWAVRASAEAAEERLEALREQRQKVEQARTTREQAKAALEATSRRQTEVQERLEALPETEYDDERLEQIEGDLAELRALDESLADARGLVSQIAATDSDIARHRKAKAEAKARLRDAREALVLTSYDPERHREAREAMKQAREQAQDADREHATAQEAVRGASEAVRTAEQALAAYDRRAQERAAVAEQHQLQERVDARLSEFRVAIASTIRPEMEEYVSGFVHVLTDGRHEAVELAEDFSVTLYESGTPMEVVSGGTKNIAALATRLALSQMISERAGHPLSLMWLDEPFDSIDENRRGNVLRLIQRLSGVFEQVFVTSHVAETRDAVEHVVELAFDEPSRKTTVVRAPEAGPTPHLPYPSDTPEDA